MAYRVLPFLFNFFSRRGKHLSTCNYCYCCCCRCYRWQPPGGCLRGPWGGPPSPPPRGPETDGRARAFRPSPGSVAASHVCGRLQSCRVSSGHPGSTSTGDFRPRRSRRAPPDEAGPPGRVSAPRGRLPLLQRPGRQRTPFARPSTLPWLEQRNPSPGAAYEAAACFRERNADTEAGCTGVGAGSVHTGKHTQPVASRSSRSCSNTDTTVFVTQAASAADST